MSRNLSQIIAELFAAPMEGKELSSRVQHLGDEIRKVVHSEDTMFGKFNGLLEPFRTIIPDEKQRYQAALQALSTTSKLSRQEIVKALSGQLEELKIVEKGLAPAQQAWRDGLKGMDARAQQLKGEIAQLRERMAQLESEEKAVQAGMAARVKELELAEKTVRELFADIGAEISALNKKVEEWTAETPAAQPAPPAAQPSPKTEPPKSDAPAAQPAPPAVQPGPKTEPPKSDAPAVQPAPPAAQPGPKTEPPKSDAPAKKKEVEQKIEIKASHQQQDTKFQRKCPMCGGAFQLLELEDIWQCYTCAYEEPATDADKDMSEEQSEPTDAPTPDETPGSNAEAESSSSEPTPKGNAPAGTKKDSSRFGSQPGAKKKSCPVCYKRMTWHPGEKVWRCPSGHHERKGGPGQGSRW